MNLHPSHLHPQDISSPRSDEEQKHAPYLKRAVPTDEAPSELRRPTVFGFCAASA